MNFQAAYAYMKNGHAISLPEWGGFWSWDEEDQTIYMHTRKGEVLDIRQSNNWDYTQSFMFRNDWLILEDVAQTEHVLSVHQAEAEEEVSEELYADIQNALSYLMDLTAQGVEEECPCLVCTLGRVVARTDAD